MKDKRKRFSGVLFILFLGIFGAAFLTISLSYFNTKEINLASSLCYENGGEVQLEIHNNITSSYSFACKK